MKTKHFLVFSFLITGKVFAQQDKHLSMWNENPSSLNAGAVGVMDEDVRLLANYRMQWLTLEGQPFTTANFSLDTKVKLKNSRVMRLIGAVSVVDRALVNSNLDSLLFAVRKALIVNNHDNPAALTKLEFGTAVFKLPDSQDQYAFFELDITISYVEVL